MFSLIRRIGESILIYPSNDLPADMTVAELFKDGVVEVKVMRASNDDIKLVIATPKELEIVKKN